MLTDVDLTQKHEISSVFVKANCFWCRDDYTAREYFLELEIYCTVKYSDYPKVEKAATILLINAILCLFFLIQPHEKLDDLYKYSTYILSITFLFMAVLFAIMVFRMQLRAVETVQTEKDNMEKSCKRINTIIETMKKSFNLGEDLKNIRNEAEEPL